MKTHFVLLLFTAFGFLASATEIVNLKTEYTTTPLGIDVENPRFSWIMQSDVAGAYQKAYRIVVVDEQGEIVWNSTKVKSDISLNIRYEGRPLKPQTRSFAGNTK